MTRRRRWALLLAFGLAAALSALLGTLLFGLADLRPDTLRDQDSLTAEQTQRGRALLQAMEQAHGGRDAWLDHANVEVTLTDHWPGVFAAGAPWPANPARLQLTLAPASDNARVTFLDSDAQGEAWGMQHWASYRVDAQGAVTFEPFDGAWFYVPTLAYFFEAAMRLPEGQYVADAGPRELNGVTYDTVYLTWGSVAPRDDIDQYVAWIDPTTHRLAFLEFTVRDRLGLLTSVAIYEGWHDVDGLQVPGTITIALGLDALDRVMHRITIHDVRFDAPHPTTTLLPDPARRTHKQNHGQTP